MIDMYEKAFDTTDTSLIRKNYGLYSIYLLLALVLTTIGVFIGQVIYMNQIVLFILFFASMFAFVGTKGEVKKVMFFLFCLIEGLFISPMVSYYLALNPLVISQAMIGTVIVTTVALFVGYRVKDLSFLSFALFAALIGYLVLMIIGCFIPMPFLSQIGAILFSIYIAYDINAYKRVLLQTNGDVGQDVVLTQVMNQYLNIINLFLKLIRIFSEE